MFCIIPGCFFLMIINEKIIENNCLMFISSFNIFSFQFYPLLFYLHVYIVCLNTHHFIKIRPSAQTKD